MVAYNIGHSARMKHVHYIFLCQINFKMVLMLGLLPISPIRNIIIIIIMVHGQKARMCPTKSLPPVSIYIDPELF